MGAVDFGSLAQGFHRFMTASHGAGQGAADADVVFSGFSPAPARIKSDDFLHLNGFQAEFGRDPGDGFFRDVAKMVLNKVQDGQHGTPLGNGIMRNDFVDLGKEVSRQVHDVQVARGTGDSIILRPPNSGKANL